MKIKDTHDQACCHAAIRNDDRWQRQDADIKHALEALERPQTLVMSTVEMTPAALTDLATTLATLNLDRVQNPHAQPTLAQLADHYWKCRQANRAYVQARDDRHADRLSPVGTHA